ncbi:DUF397 domain-containing protein [Streptomyces scopuliridis]|uniref:DUF397 domain-containing protein n=1 Tax=Streptomyces scopuliridis TaxID=452529 RepID=A0ACD4ZKN9_9ACTN|nr:DUF397 domain-containing protein [Streptomyces scopuliridis]WSB34704.1 DUF397 domain-containing protein [Streptomyces scopuliridis]WSB98954.1 DUF397 domain-containing protein [Streptomyces scopuliridis]WSC07344.1 DUF397 domain-containing protein [Streptomyces scopuliridis]
MSDKFEFRKSSYSNLTGECVEVALNLPGTVAVRDSKRQTGPVVHVTPAAWDAFRVGLRKP